MQESSRKSSILPKEGRTNLFLEICVISYVTELFYLGCTNLLIFAGNIIIFLVNIFTKEYKIKDYHI